MKLPLLIDFDGVLRIVNEPAPGITEFLQYIYNEKIPAFVISNSTLKTSDDIRKFFLSKNITLNIPVITAAEITLKYVKANYRSAAVYCIEPIKKLFSEILDYEKPEAVVVGDNKENWGYKMMNEIFTFVQNGSDFIAMHKNKFWYPDGNEPKLDAGSFIKAIEFAAGKEAKLIGKPSPEYFFSVLKMLGFREGDRFLMLGDDLESDINAAQKIGGTGILINTGKTKYPLNFQQDLKPDFEAMDLYEVIKLLKKIRSD